jgi:hypothetical protein
MAAYVNGFEHDVFISYAHLDDKSGWVAALDDALTKRLGEALGTRVAIYRDKRELDGLDRIDDTLGRHIDRAAMLLTVVSPAYLASKPCLWELRRFASRGRVDVGSKSNIVRVRKMPLRPGMVEHEELEPSKTIGFAFFVDETRVEFEPGPRSSTDELFRDQVKVLADAIAEVLSTLKEHAQQRGATLFLAEVPGKLANERSSVENELGGLGHLVLPRDTLLKDGALDTERLNDALKQAALSVHLFGDSYGMVPDGSEISLPHAQFEAALAAQVPLVVWIAPGARPEPRQEALLKHLRQTLRVVSRMSLVETALGDLLDYLPDRLRPKPEPPPLPAVESGRQVYVVCPREDLASEHLTQLRIGIEEEGFPVALPIFEAEPGDLGPIEAQQIIASVATVIYYGRARDEWVRQKRGVVVKSLAEAARGSAHWRAIYMSSPETDIKMANFGPFRTERRAHKRDIAGFSPLLVLGDCGAFDRKHLEPLFERLASSSSKPEPARERAVAAAASPVESGNPPSDPVSSDASASRDTKRPLPESVT